MTPQELPERLAAARLAWLTERLQNVSIYSVTRGDERYRLTAPALSIEPDRGGIIPVRGEAMQPTGAKQSDAGGKQCKR